jgi:hypothetical protein
MFGEKLVASICNNLLLSIKERFGGKWCVESILGASNYWR